MSSKTLALMGMSAGLVLPKIKGELFRTGADVSMKMGNNTPIVKW